MIQARSGVEYIDLGAPGISRVYCVRTAVGPLAFGGSASRAIHCRSETGATSVISVGMAFGVDRDTQRHADVLVSRSVLPYDNRDIRSDAGMPKYSYGRVVEFPAKQPLIDLLAREAQRRNRGYKVHFGALLTGAAHIACRAYRDHLAIRCKKDEPVIGGEMEGSGLLALADKKLPPWIVVKAIVDFADEARDGDAKKYRKQACRNAAELVLEALRSETSVLG